MRFTRFSVIAWRLAKDDELLRGNILADAFGKLLVVEVGIKTVLGQQLLVGAAFHDLATLNHQNHISGQDCGEAVGDGQSGAIFHQRFERGLDQALRMCIQGAGCFNPRNRLIISQHIEWARLD